MQIPKAFQHFLTFMGLGDFFFFDRGILHGILEHSTFHTSLCSHLLYQKHSKLLTTRFKASTYYENHNTLSLYVKFILFKQNGQRPNLPV